METKTSYSSVSAKSPKAHDATPTTGQQTKANNTTGTKRNPDRFLGHNQTNLKGILIPKDASAKHYHELKDRLETLEGPKYIPQVGSSIKHLIRFKRNDFAPTKPTVMEYSTTVTYPATQTTQVVEVPGLKETLMDMYKEELKKKADEWIQYQQDMEKIYRLTLGQVDDGINTKLKGPKLWKAIDDSKYIVELLKEIWDLCFQSSQTKVHPVTNVLRAIRKLLCTQQRKLDAESYVKMTKENLDVVKSLGGTLVCKARVSYKLECNPTYAAYDYNAYLTLTGTTRTAIDHAVEQRALAALIIEGSDTNSSTLRQVLADNYALQQNNYPATSVEALDMVVAFKDSKKSTQSRGNNQNNLATPTDGTRQGNRKKKEESTNNQESNMFAQQGNGTGNNLSTDQHSQQLLMTVVESGKVFTPSKQTTYMFINIGMLSQGSVESPSAASLSTSSTSTLDSDSDSEDADSDDDIPDLVPQTSRYDDNAEEEQWLANTDYHFSNDAEYLFIQLKSEGGDGLANVLSLPLVSDQYRVTMDMSIDNAIYVHKDGGTRRFQRSSSLDCYRAKKVQEMQEVLGFPTSQELIKMIDNNIIKDCPITKRDITIMTDISGKHASILKGKSVRQQSPHTREDITPIPDSILKAYRDATLFVDIITVNTAVAINIMKHHTLAKTIRAIAGQYHSRGFRVTKLHADNQFEGIRDSLLDMDHPITVHCVPAGQHAHNRKKQ
eukprot:jgi/Psemu1/52760/gm1.52760_g